MAGISRVESLSIFSPHWACAGPGRVGAIQRLSSYSSRRVTGTEVYTWPLNPGIRSMLLGTVFWFSKPREGVPGIYTDALNDLDSAPNLS